MNFNKFLLFSTLLIILGGTSFILAQSRFIEVPSGVGTLNEVIAGDTTATGERIDPENTVYVLERYGFYLLTGTISNTGFPLKIWTAEGGGTKPIIQPGVGEGGVSSPPFRPRGDFHIKGAYVTAMDELGQTHTVMFRLSADDIKIIAEDCHLDYTGQSIFRLDNKNNSVYVLNSVVSNSGSMASPDNGRGIDDRGNDIDIVVFENSTFYNFTSRILRDGGGKINYARVVHNTVVNVGQMGISFGEIIELEFKNNLFVNTSFFGKRSTSAWSSFDVLPLREDLVNQGVEQKLTILNNNFYTAPELINAQPDSILASPIFNAVSDSLINAIGTKDNLLNEAITFTDQPALPVDLVVANWDFTITPRPEFDRGGGGPEYGGVQLPFNFAYPTSTASYTYSTNGQPLGSLKWFGMVVGVDENLDEVPVNFTLENNYPNPFNPSTVIKYSVPELSNVNLKIYNSLGQVVKTLVNTTQAAGSYSLQWDGTSDIGVKVSSGIYIYRLTTDKFSASKKMMLLK
ncbi:hypothetical protein ASZ90_003271 [hydrocarbon metagenome]|uniref:FlgD/Vpr Ig-like domain-containing protein n=1 Tax=hydrocarbon metagenome TaxID=938273 RepID=A0A0W8G1H5_9ZZZZ